MCYGESSTSDKKGMNSAFCRACFLEATALDPHASSWLSQHCDLPRAVLISSGSESALPGCWVCLATPGEQETVLRELAPRSCLSGGQWPLRPTAWSIHLSKHALGLKGAQPQKYKGGKPQSQAEGAQSCSRDGPGDGVGRSTGGVHVCDGNHRRAWPSL